jgi:hypothetical protein
VLVVADQDTVTVLEDATPETFVGAFGATVQATVVEVLFCFCRYGTRKYKIRTIIIRIRAITTKIIAVAFNPTSADSDFTIIGILFLDIFI